MTTFESAYQAGRDCALNGPNESNCCFRWFATRTMTSEWERGKREAEAERQPANKGGDAK